MDYYIGMAAEDGASIDRWAPTVDAMFAGLVPPEY